MGRFGQGIVFLEGEDHDGIFFLVARYDQHLHGTGHLVQVFLEILAKGGNGDGFHGYGLYI